MELWQSLMAWMILPDHSGSAIRSTPAGGGLDSWASPNYLAQATSRSVLRYRLSWEPLAQESLRLSLRLSWPPSEVGKAHLLRSVYWPLARSGCFASFAEAKRFCPPEKPVRWQSHLTGSAFPSDPTRGQSGLKTDGFAICFWLRPLCPTS